MARSGQPAAQVEGEAFHLGQLGHRASLGARPTDEFRCSACDTGAMHPVTPLPAAGEVFLDARGADRALRVSWHAEADVVVLSLWQRRHLHRAPSGCPSRRSPT